MTTPSNAKQQLTHAVSYKDFTLLPIWDTITAEVVVSGIKAVIDEVRDAFKSIETIDNPTWDSVMIPLEQLEWRLATPSNRISHLQSVNFSDEIKSAFEEVRPLVVNLQTEISQSHALYQHLQQIQQSETLSPTQQRILEQNIKSMQHAGVHLEGDAQKTYQSIKQSLVKLQESFQNNLVSEAKTAHIEVTDAQEIAGLPDAVVEAAAKKAQEDGGAPSTNATTTQGPWSFSISAANYITIMEQCQSKTLRERMYRAFKSRGMSQAFDNRPILEEILSLRQQLATLLGYNHYADLSIDTKMADSVADIRSLLNDLKKAAIPVAQRELTELKAFIATHAHASNTQQNPQSAAADSDPLQPWDIPYWVEQYRQTHFSIDQEMVRQHLQVPKVMTAMFDLMQQLFGIEIRSVDAKEIPKWHEDVQFYEVYESGQRIAGFFMDAFERTGLKREGAWMNTIVDRSRALAAVDQSHTLPVALFVMNARPPQAGKPGLFSLNEAETLFHEFGHALQHMLTTIDEGQASGINLVEWDAVEIASQFNENWLYQKSLLTSMSAHVDTGEPLDEAIIDKIIQSRHYWAGNATLRQLMFALSDLAIHEAAGFESNVSPYELEKTIRDELIQTPYLDEETQLPAFGHLFAGGYAAGYYSYKWAEVMAADAFSLFEEAGLENIEALQPIAKKYRETILALGGSRSALEVFREYRGRDATVDALLAQQGLSN